MRILSESILTLHDAAQLLPSNRAGKRVSFSTIWRWVLKGIRANDGQIVKLEAARVGGRWLTSKEALERFSVALTPVVAGTTVPVRTPSRRQRENAAAASALERMGIKS